MLSPCLQALTVIEELQAALRSPCNLLFPRLSSPSSPSLSSQQRGSSPRIMAGASSGPAPTAPALSCAEGSRAGRRTPGGVSPEWSRGAESPPSAYAHAAGDGAQGAVGLLAYECTLPGHVDLFTHQHPQVPLDRAALHPFFPQPVWIPGVALTQMQDPALGPVEPHEVHTGPHLQLAQVPLDDIPSLRCVDRTAQLGVTGKLAEGALNPTVCVIAEDTKQYWSQYGALRDTSCHPSPSGH